MRGWTLALALALAGCAPLTGTAATHTHATHTPAAPTMSAARRTAPPQPHEVPGPPVHERASTSAAAPAAAVRAFASAYINWNAGSVAAVMASLAARSIGQARSVAALAAAQTAGDYELHDGGVANHGTVEAIAPLPGHADRYVVVTLERTTASASSAYQGLAPAWHVALATVTQLAPGRWAVSGWEPES